MKQTGKLTTCLLASLIFLTFVALSLALANTQTTTSSEPYITLDVYKAIEENGTARVIVMFSKGLNKQDINTMLEEQRISLEAITQSLNIYAGTINAEQLSLLSSMPYVKSIELDKVIMPARFQALQTTQPREQEQEQPILSTLSTFQALSQEQNQDYYPLGMIQAYDAWKLQVRGVNLSGDGIVICVIGTGVNYSHPELGGCTTEQFLAGNCPTIIGGYDFANNDPDPMDDHGGSSRMAYLILSTTKDKAQIVTVKTLDEYGWGSLSWWYSGLDWCITHKDDYNISIIADPTGIWPYGVNTPEECQEASEPEYEALKEEALANNISIVSGAGDWEEYLGLPSTTYPGCLPDVLSVGAINENEEVFFQRGALLDMVSPGIELSVFSTNPELINGTGYALSITAGAAALLQHFSQLVYGKLLSPQQLYEALKHSSITVYDPVTQLSFPRLNIMDSITYIAPNATLSLKKGWNLISLPLEPINASPLAVFSECIEQGNYISNNLFRLEPGHGYDKWTPENNYDMQTGRGYWLLLQHECNVSYKGVPANTSIRLRQGWNLIGFPANDLNLSPIYWPNVTVSNGTTTLSVGQAAVAGWLQPTLYYYDSNHGYKAVSLDSDDEQWIEPGHGYWILSFRDGLELVW